MEADRNARSESAKFYWFINSGSFDEDTAPTTGALEEIREGSRYLSSKTVDERTGEPKYSAKERFLARSFIIEAVKLMQPKLLKDKQTTESVEDDINFALNYYLEYSPISTDWHMDDMRNKIRSSAKVNPDVLKALDVVEKSYRDNYSQYLTDLDAWSDKVKKDMETEDLSITVGKKLANDVVDVLSTEIRR